MEIGGQVLTGGGTGTDKAKEWQMELLMEKLRSKTSAFKSLVETAKNLRMAMLVCIAMRFLYRSALFLLILILFWNIFIHRTNDLQLTALKKTSCKNVSIHCSTR